MNVLAEAGSGLQTMRAALDESAGIRASVWWNVALLAGSLVALLFDRRTMLGLNPWVKPIKFEVSVIVFLVTIGCMLWRLSGPEFASTKAWLGWGFGVAMIVENTIIAMQSARGLRSHMNYETAVDAGLFAVMGVFILLNTVLAAWLLVLWSRENGALPPVVAWGVRLGLLMLLAGSIEGVRMVAHGSHTVGADDGLPGLPFVNSSSGHGDLRVAHFFAIHGLQIFPLAGMALARTDLRTGVQVSTLVGLSRSIACRCGGCLPRRCAAFRWWGCEFAKSDRGQEREVLNYLSGGVR